MATLSRRGTTCVKCNTFQPKDGKLLGCAHLICAGCGREEIAQDTNTIKCLSCAAITKAVVSGVGVVDQLMSCEPYLYQAPLDDAARRVRERSTLCCEFCDEDDAASATHECEACGGALLCRKDAERHSRKRIYAGHVVKEFFEVKELKREQRADGRHRHATRSARCLVHKHNDVVTFCKTCSHSICSQCLAAGHQGHTMVTLSSVAAEQLSAVRAAMGSSRESLQSASQSAGSMETPTIQVMLASVSDDMDEIRQEAEAASRVVTDMFDQVEAIIQQKRQELLRQIDTIQWQQLEARESKQQRLYGIEENYSTLTQLVKCMTGGEMDDEDMIRISGLVISNLAKMRSDLDLERAPLPRSKISATPVSLHELETQVQSLVLVKESPPIDVTKIITSLTDKVYLGEQSIIRLAFPGVTNTSTQSLTAKISQPFGGSHNVHLADLSDSSGAELVMLGLFTLTDVGRHSLEICDTFGNMKSVPFECHRRAAPTLDPRTCSPLITLSENNHVVTYSHRYLTMANVAASEGYTAGRNTWNIAVRSAGRGCYYMAVGICTLPDTTDYDSDDLFYSNPSYYWKSSGQSFTNGSYSDHDCSSIRCGDTATLTLDCQQKTLEIHHHRTNERSVIPDVNCDKALYPAVCIWEPFTRVEIS